MKLPRAEWQERPGMDVLLAALDVAGGATRYVGGCVRDTLLDLPVSDVDLATKLTPQEVMERLKSAGIRAVPTGLAHGTVTAVLEHKPIEITTLRRDVSTDGRRATIAYTDNWREDAARRDFTINALSADPLGGNLFDYFDGLSDLEARRVRFIGDPLQRIAEDHLRILRFFRFHARFGNAADAEGLAACAGRANDLMALSRERIADELLKLLALPDPAPTVALMIQHGILKPVLPEIADAATMRALVAREVEAGIAPDPLRRLAALLPPDPEIAQRVAARLRLSNKAQKRLAAAAATTLDEPEALAYRIGRDAAIDRLLLHGGDPADAAHLLAWEAPRLPIGGGALVEMGLKAGPIVAATLAAIEAEWIALGFPMDGSMLRALARRQVDQALRSSQ